MKQFLTIIFLLLTVSTAYAKPRTLFAGGGGEMEGGMSIKTLTQNSSVFYIGGEGGWIFNNSYGLKWGGYGSWLSGQSGYLATLRVIQFLNTDESIQSVYSCPSLPNLRK